MFLSLLKNLKFMIMKKLFLVGAFALFGALNAQQYKPTTGDVTVDLGVSGGLGNTSITLPDQGFGTGAMFKARYFKAEKLAYRATLFLANKTDNENPADDITTKDSQFGLGLGLGVEKHFTGTERLSPYVGGDVLIGYASKNKKQTATVGGTTIVNERKGPNSFKLGVRGVFGADYYFVQNVFLGVEAGLALIYENEGDITIKNPGTPDVTINGGNSLNISPAVVTGIRIGYIF